MMRFILISIFTVAVLFVQGQSILILKNGQRIHYKKKLKFGDNSLFLKDLDKIKHDISYDSILARIPVQSGKIEYMKAIPDAEEGRQVLDFIKRNEHAFLKAEVDGEIKILSREVKTTTTSPGFGGQPGMVHQTTYTVWYLEYNAVLNRIEFNGETLIKSKRKEQERIDRLRSFFKDNINDSDLTSRMEDEGFDGTFDDVKTILNEYNTKHFKEQKASENEFVSFIRTPQFYNTEPVKISVNSMTIRESFGENEFFNISLPASVPIKICINSFCRIMTLVPGVDYNLDILFDPELNKYSIHYLSNYEFLYWKKGIERKMKKSKK